MTAQVVQLQRAVAATSMENVNLKDELVRVTKSEEAIVNTGVSQRAVREGSKSFSVNLKSSSLLFSGKSRRKKLFHFTVFKKNQ